MDTGNGRPNVPLVVHDGKLSVPRNLQTQEGDREIINISEHYTLTPAERTLLTKGLTFVPVWENDINLKNKTRHDLQTYHRKIKLAAYFEPNKDRKHKPFTPKSKWTPRTENMATPIRTMIEKNLKYFNRNFKTEEVKSNLNIDEINALTRLKNNKQIIIKPADKGSAVVVMDRVQYLWEGNRQLADRKYYVPLRKPIFPETIPMVQEILVDLQNKGFINNKQKTYLSGPPQPRPRRFYLLPKIHKNPKDWSKPFKIPPGRPIVSDCESETYFTAEFIDYFLNPLSTKHPSYIKDTYDFLGKIRHMVIPEDAFLFTMDVNSLYTNIDTGEGIKAVREILEHNPDFNRPDDHLIKLLEVNLTRNDFVFNDKFFLQVKGTAMGKKFAPAYANIFMAAWEKGALQTTPLKPVHYYRFLDDVWGVWTHSLTEFQDFISILNSFNSSITVKAEIHRTTVNFLDVTVFKGTDFHRTGKLDTKVYFKTTDTHALLYKSSFHPKHTFKGIIKSQLLRFKRICSREQDFRDATRVLFRVLTTRGYSRSFLRKSLKQFHLTGPERNTSVIPVIMEYSTSTTTLIRTMKENFNKAFNGSTILNNYRLIAAYRRPKNLQDHLVTAMVPRLTVEDDGNRKRKDRELFRQRTWVRNWGTKEIFKLNNITKSTAHNCVYLISCTKCKQQYVGETKNTLATRFYQHKHNILTQSGRNRLLIKHFGSHGWGALRVTVLESNPTWSQLQRRQVERRWIKQLKTIHPGGLNER